MSSQLSLFPLRCVRITLFYWPLIIKRHSKCRRKNPQIVKRTIDKSNKCVISMWYWFLFLSQVSQVLAQVPSRETSPKKSIIIQCLCVRWCPVPSAFPSCLHNVTGCSQVHSGYFIIQGGGWWGVSLLYDQNKMQRAAADVLGGAKGRNVYKGLLTPEGL